MVPGDINQVRLALWERRTRPFIICAAILPLLGVFVKGANDALVWTVAFGTWAVFLVDLLVHMSLSRGYLRRRVGLFDLFIVVTTFPWFLLVGTTATVLAQVLRLARLERIAKVASDSAPVRRFLSRLGRPVLYATALWFTCSAIVTRAEGAEHGFKNLGTGLWWGIVTLTTVGYGDLTPTTQVGRLAAAALMIAGIGLLGTVAASLASLFRGEDTSEQFDPAVAVAGLQEEVAQLRTQLQEMRAELLAALEPPPGRD